MRALLVNRPPAPRSGQLVVLWIPASLSLDFSVRQRMRARGNLGNALLIEPRPDLRIAYVDGCLHHHQAFQNLTRKLLPRVGNGALLPQDPGPKVDFRGEYILPPPFGLAFHPIAISQHSCASLLDLI